ncbi:hypothetical protein [Dyadobacter sp. OTU695]|uniref:hypothetical protein n=1 Tax=Dyadobacter sp. OTU695 TaxID=3043860 RepID=UPI00313EC030
MQTTLLTRIKNSNQSLYYCAVAHLILAVIWFGLAMVDTRELLGVNIWIKPIKFALSISIYCLTWPLLLDLLPFDRIKERFASYTVFTMCFEMFAVASQAARGELSHYNMTGTYNSLLFALMGLIVFSQTLFSIYIGILFFRIRPVQISPAMLWAVRLGILMTALFALEGGLMSYRMAHTVGGPDGGPGISMLNWSRIHGDLRVAHFVGLHALQLLPLSVTLFRIKKAMPSISIALLYFLFTSFLFINALLGHPTF